MTQKISQWITPDGPLYVNQPGRALAIAIAWSAASVCFFSAAAAVLLIAVTPVVVHDREWLSSIWDIAQALLWLGYLTLGLIAFVIGAAVHMAGRRQVVRPSVKLRGQDRP